MSKKPSVYVLASLSIHLGFFLSLPKVASKPSPVVYTPVQINVRESTVKPEPLKKGEAKAEEKLAEHKTKAEKKSAAPILPQPAAPLSLPSITALPSQKDLGLPVPAAAPASNRPSFAQHQWNESATGTQKQALLRDAGFLHTSFDVPLEVRKIGVTGLGYAWITYDAEKQRMTLNTLGGEPILRAVLYQHLLEKITQRTLKEILSQLGEKQIKIYLHIEPLSLDSVDDENSFHWSRNRLDIVKRVVGPPPPTGGIPLPDEEAEKAKRWDRYHHFKLIESPAFRGPRSNEILCESC